jgi:hypothetical protein
MRKFPAIRYVYIIFILHTCPSIDGWAEPYDFTSLLGGTDQEQQRRSGQPTGAVQEWGPERGTTENYQPGLCECYLSLSLSLSPPPPPPTFHTHFCY